MKVSFENLRNKIERAFTDQELIHHDEYRDAVYSLIEGLDTGEYRCAEKVNGEWIVHEWVKKGILLYFLLKKSVKMEIPPFEYFDKIPLKTNYEEKNVRVVPPAVARYGACVSENVILMPSYINIGAYVGRGSMIDTWATIGSCAQIGANVHISGGVGIGGVLEPLQALPVIVEDNAFIGSRCIIVEGVKVEEGAVIGAGVTITSSTKIIDVTTRDAKEYKRIVPKYSVVIPGTYRKSFPAGDYNVNCALIIGKRNDSTDRKTSLNDVLRDYQVSV